jgi:hypothetical protein
MVASWRGNCWCFKGMDILVLSSVRLEHVFTRLMPTKVFHCDRLCCQYGLSRTSKQSHLHHYTPSTLPLLPANPVIISIQVSCQMFFPFISLLIFYCLIKYVPKTRYHQLDWKQQWYVHWWPFVQALPVKIPASILSWLIYWWDTLNRVIVRGQWPTTFIFWVAINLQGWDAIS